MFKDHLLRSHQVNYAETLHTLYDISNYIKNNYSSPFVAMATKFSVDVQWGNVEIGNVGYYNRYFDFLKKITERFKESYVLLHACCTYC